MEDRDGAGQVVEAVVRRSSVTAWRTATADSSARRKTRMPGCVPGGVGTDVAEALVERDEQSVLGLSGRRYLGIWVASQVLGDDRIDLMVVSDEDLAQ